MPDPSYEFQDYDGDRVSVVARTDGWVEIEKDDDDYPLIFFHRDDLAPLIRALRWAEEKIGRETEPEEQEMSDHAS